MVTNPIERLMRHKHKERKSGKKQPRKLDAPSSCKRRKIKPKRETTGEIDLNPKESTI
jgi:hypothetical protein